MESGYWNNRHDISHFLGAFAVLWLVLLPKMAAAQQSVPNADVASTANGAAAIPVSSYYGQESLRSLSLGDSNLRPAEPIIGERDDYPEFTRELLQVQWRPGDPIDLYVIRPRGLPKPATILYLYSYPSETDRFRDNEYCKRLTADGYAAIGFVSALTGQRYHDRPMREWFVSQLPEALIESVHDVQMILNYLAKRGDVDVSRIGMFGQGSGATIAILAGATDSRIRVIDALQPWGDWPVWLAKSSLIPESERPNYLKSSFLSDVAPLDSVRWLSQVQSAKLRLQIVPDDPITPADAAQAIKGAAPQSVQVVEYRSKREQHDALGNGRAFDWIKEQVRLVNLHIQNPSSVEKSDGVHSH